MPIPTPLRLDDSYCTAMRHSLAANYFSGWPADYLDSQGGKADLEAHVSGRMLEFEAHIMPWIAEGFDLGGKSALEIGCGTGSSTIPIARATRALRAFDIGGPSLTVARERARLLGVDNAEILELDPNWAQSERSAKAFAEGEGPVDVVFFIALLEHLTLGERLNALRGAWSALSPGGILVVYETPNRLGWFDWHSFLLPFFHALPDELAVAYSNRSERRWFELSREGDVVENLYRLGRGVSYHEFDLAIGLDEFTVLNDGYSKHLAHRAGLANPAYDAALEEIFAAHLPRVALGFTRPSLDLILKKERPDPAKRRRARVSDAETLRERLRDAQRRLEETERRLASQTDLALSLLRVTARNAAEIAAEPGQLPERIRSWWRRRLGRS